MSDPRLKQVGGSHYKDMPIQPGEFIRLNGIGWYEGNAIKYICRHRQKGGATDLQKAIHYLELALREYREEEQDVASDTPSINEHHDGPTVSIEEEGR